MKSDRRIASTITIPLSLTLAGVIVVGCSDANQTQNTGGAGSGGSSEMGGAGGTSGSSSSSGIAGMGGGGFAGSGGNGGAGGMGAGGNGGSGGAMVCTPGEIVSCYTGLPETEGVGICQSGIKVCNVDGSAFGDCLKQVLPQTEDCTLMLDEDCDGQVNEPDAGCVCIPGSVALCYGGPMGSADVGICKSGLATCNALGTGFGTCLGEVLPAAENCQTPEDESCSGPIFEGCGEHIFSERFGDSAYQFMTDLRVEPSGSFWMSGFFDGTIDFGGGTMLASGSASMDGLVVHFDAQGKHLWSKAITQAQPIYVDTMDVDMNGNLFLGGRFFQTVNFGGGSLTSAGNDDFFMLKLDSAGNHVWSKRAGAANQELDFRRVRTDAAGNSYFASNLRASLDFGGGALTFKGGTNDIFVVSYDPTGNYRWGKSFGGTGSDTLGDLIVTAAGKVILAGTFDGSADLGAGLVASLGQTDGFIIELDTNGVYQWSTAFGTANPDMGQALAIGAAGEMVIGGQFDRQPHVAMYDSLHNLMWLKNTSGTVFSGALTRSVAIAPDGNVIAGGVFNTFADFGGGAMTTAGGSDLFLVKLSPQGNHIWSKQYGSFLDESFIQLGVDMMGNTITASNLSGIAPFDFGGELLSTAGSFDIFIWKSAP